MQKKFFFQGKVFFTQFFCFSFLCYSLFSVVKNTRFCPFLFLEQTNKIWKEKNFPLKKFLKIKNWNHKTIISSFFRTLFFPNHGMREKIKIKKNNLKNEKKKIIENSTNSKASCKGFFLCKGFSVSKTKGWLKYIRKFLRWIYNAAMQWKKFIIFFNCIYYIIIILTIKIKVLILASFVLWKKWIKIEQNIENWWICDIEEKFVILKNKKWFVFLWIELHSFAIKKLEGLKKQLGFTLFLRSNELFIHQEKEEIHTFLQ